MHFIMNLQNIRSRSYSFTKSIEFLIWTEMCNGTTKYHSFMKRRIHLRRIADEKEFCVWIHWKFLILFRKQIPKYEKKIVILRKEMYEFMFLKISALVCYLERYFHAINSVIQPIYCK